jgi:hypothetical protein
MAHRFAAVCWLMAVALCGCSASGGVAGGTAFEGDGFSVRVPDGWQARATDPDDWRGGQTIALISSQALDPQCDGPDATNCHAPLEALDDGSQLVWWVTTNCAGAACELPDGERLLIGGREGRLIQRTALCDDLGATSESAYVVAVSPQRLDAIVTCDRVAAASVQAQVQDLIESVDWRTP